MYLEGSSRHFLGGQIISGAHVIVYRKNADADRAFSRDVLGFISVDADHGWLIFALAPTEAAFHTSNVNGAHELYLMCDDLRAEMASLANKNVTCTEVEEAPCGSITKLRLPGGGEISLYWANHPSSIGLGPRLEMKSQIMALPPVLGPRGDAYSSRTHSPEDN